MHDSEAGGSMRTFVLCLMLFCMLACAYSFRLSGRSVRIQPKVSSTEPLATSELQQRSPALQPFELEIKRRRSFAIISHPDAGKTTLTEKLLLFGGAIQDAGAVKAKADQRKATSDWMEIEKQRGISVTSTVLSFEYTPDGGKHYYHLNLLDTPGHQDFSEDTYRTLAAADNCVMLIDGAKGIEDRTRKLFAVCKLRKLPVFTFANKFDRPALSPFDLVDQIEKEFGLECCPVNWPIGHGDEFQGVYDRTRQQVHLFERGHRRKKVHAQVVSLHDPDIEELIGSSLYQQLQDDIAVLESMLPQPSLPRIQAGEQTPLFFGSAMTNFGVELFLKDFLQMAQSPPGRLALVEGWGRGDGDKCGDRGGDRDGDIGGDEGGAAGGGAGTVGGKDDSSPKAGSAVERIVSPTEHEFSGFVFKLQANLDPRHRDRMAFVRICSGVFRKGLKVQHSRLQRALSLSSAQNLFAQDREEVIVAYPGDVIGIHNPGSFAIGDTMYTGSGRVAFPGIPSFSPEKFAYVRNPNPSVHKKFQKGLKELLDEGAVQLLRVRGDDDSGTPLLAAVGQLQFEVVTYRLKNEYGVDSAMEPLDFTIARWAGGGWDAVDRADEAGRLHGVFQCQDAWGRPVLLFRNPWKVSQLEIEVRELSLEPWALPPSERKR